jgi:hypothetical protein
LVLVVVELATGLSCRPIGLRFHHLEPEPFGWNEAFPESLFDTLRAHQLRRGLNGEIDHVLDNTRFALHPWSQSLPCHVHALDVRVAGQHLQRRGIASHLDVWVAERVLVPLAGLGALIQSSE